MAKVTAPLLSLGASGTIGKTQTYARWRGVPYARQRVVPANPRSAEQQLTRTAFAWLQGFWKLMSPDAQAPWNAFAQGKPLTGRNALASANVSALRSAATLADLVSSPGAKGGSALSGATATPDTGEIDITVVVPELPDGWQIVKVVGLAIPDQDPNTGNKFVSVTESNAVSPYALSFTGLAAGATYWAVWPVYMKPDGSTAYGPDLHGIATVT